MIKKLKKVPRMLRLAKGGKLKEESPPQPRKKTQILIRRPFNVFHAAAESRQWAQSLFSKKSELESTIRETQRAKPRVLRGGQTEYQVSKDTPYIQTGVEYKGTDDKPVQVVPSSESEPVPDTDYLSPEEIVEARVKFSGTSDAPSDEAIKAKIASQSANPELMKEFLKQDPHLLDRYISAAKNYLKKFKK